MGRNNLIQIRQGTAIAWSGTNPTLGSGEPGFDNTNNILKIGDGSKNWNNLTGVSLNTSGTTNFIPVFQSDGSFGDSIINESGNTIGINTPAHGSSITQWVKNIGANGSWIINENTTSGYPVVFEARENGIRLGAMYSYGTAYTGGSFASIGSGGVAFSNITGPVAIGPLVASKDLIFGAGTGQYAKMTSTEFRINHDGLNRDFRVEGDSDQDLIVAHASTDRVGIGTSSPSGKLHVDGTSFFRGDIAQSGGNVVFNQLGADYNFRVEGDTDQYLLFIDGGTDRIGIGTGVPEVKLHVSATTGEGTILSQTYANNSWAGLLVRNEYNQNVASFQYGNSGVTHVPSLKNVLLIGSRQSGVPVKFYQGKETAGAFRENNERIIFDVDGNTILTAASGQHVLVSGVNLGIGDENAGLNAYHNVPLSISPGDYAVVGTPTADQQSNKIRIYDRDGNGIVGFGVSTSSFNIATSGLIHQRFWTNALERMRITYDGNVAIGHTSPNSKLHVMDNSITGSVHDMIASGTMGSTPMQVYAENESNTNESPGGFSFSSTKANGVTCGAALTASSPSDGYGWSPDIILSSRSNIPYGGATWAKRLVVTSRGRVSIPDARNGDGGDEGEYKFAVRDSVSGVVSGLFAVKAGDDGFGTYITASGTGVAFLDVDGSGSFRCPARGLGLQVVNSGGTGLLFGEIAFGTYGGSYSGTLYNGMTHSDLDGDDEYMILSRGDHTYISAQTGSASIIRGGANHQTYQLVAAPSYLSVGQYSEKMKFDSSKVEFNVSGQDLDFVVQGDSLPYLFYIDANTDNIGINRNNPATKLHISESSTYTSENTYAIKISDGADPETMGLLLGVDTGNSIAAIQGVDPGTHWNRNISMQAMGGKLGVATVDPTDTLSVSGTTRVQSLNINGAFTFPTGDGSDGQALITDGAGNLSFSNVSGAAGGGSGISDIIEDITPQLGGNLDLNGKTLVAGQHQILVSHTGISLSGTNIYDGFQIASVQDCYRVGNDNNDGLLIEKVDGNHTNVDGGIIFANRGSGGISNPSLSINGFGDVAIGKMVSPFNQGNKLSIDSGNFVFNSSNGNYDFIVSGTGSHPLIYVDPDSGTGRVGIGRKPDNYVLDVSGSTRVSPLSGATHFFTVNNTGNNELFVVKPSETVINQNGDHHDLRVEGDTDVNLFKTNASGDTVSIGVHPAFDYYKFLVYSYDKQYQQIIGGGSSGTSLLVNSYINTGVSSATAFYSYTYPVSGASLNSLIHFRAQRPESSGTVTTERGFYTDVHDGTNNRGFEGHVPTGDGNYNLYMEGSGKNYLAGNLGVGTTGEITRSFEVYDTGVKSSGSFFFAAGNGNDAVGTYVANVNPTGDSFMSLGVDGSAVNWVLMNDASGRGTDDTFVLMKGNISSDDVKLAVTNSGDLGLGTDSPSGLLHTKAPDNESNFFIQEGSRAIGSAQFLQKTHGYVSAGGLISYATGYTAGSLASVGSGGAALTNMGEFPLAIAPLYTSQPILFGAGNDEYMRSQNGNLMIGRQTSHEFGGFNTLSIDGASGSFIDLYETGTARFRLQGDATYGALQTLTAIPIRFLTDQTERMRIDESGNIGIGATVPTNVVDVVANGVHEGITIRGTNAPGLTLHDNGGVGVSYSTGGSYIGEQASSLHTGLLILDADTNNVGKGSAILFKVDNTEHVRITEGGNVGIGTDSPSTKLEVANNGNTTIRANNTSNNIINILNVDSTKGYIGTVTDHDLGIGTNSNTRIHISNSGNVGIGTSTPTGTLTVHPAETGNHTIEIARNANKASIKAVGGGSTTTNQWLVMDSAGRGSGDYASINHFVNDNVLLAYGGGNVGIGTPSPAHKLDVSGMGRFVHADGVCGLMVEDTGGSGIHIGDCAYSVSPAYAGMKHTNHTGIAEYMIISSGRSTLVSSASGYSTYLRAGGNATTYQNVIGPSAWGIGPLSNRLRVNSQSVIVNNGTGNYDFKVYGQNNTTPLIHADAATRTIGIGRDTATSRKLTIAGNSSDNTAAILIQPSGLGTDTTDGLLLSQNNAGLGYLWNFENKGLVFATNNLERMRISESGNVGIGTATPAYKLDVSGETRIMPRPSPSGHTLYLGRHPYKASIKAEGAGEGTNNNWLIMDSAGSGNSCALNYFTDDNVLLAYGGGSVGVGTIDPGSHKFRVAGGTSAFDGGDVTINDNAGNFDFRVEGQTDSSLFRTDANLDSIGIGRTAIANYKVMLQQDKLFSNIADSGQARGITIDCNHTFDNTGSATNYSIGLQSDVRQSVNHGVTNSGYSMAIDANGIALGSGTIAGVYGLRTYVGGHTGFEASGRIVETFGIRNRVFNFGSGEMTTAYGLYSELSSYSGTFGGSIQNAYHIRLRPTTEIATSNKFGMYQEGTDDKNYFAGNVGLGTATPLHPLHVVGTGRINILNVNGNFTFPSVDGSNGQVLTTDGNGAVTWTNQSGGGGGLSNIVEDTSPQLGGNLQLESKDIIGTGNMNIVGTITGTSVTLGAAGVQHLSIIRDGGGSFGNTVVTDLLGDITFAAQNTKIKMTNPAAGAQSVITMNPEGVNQDFIVEGNTDEHLFFADASTDKIGIGNSSPAHKLDVSGTINASTELRASGHPAIVSNTGVATGSVRITNIIMISSGTYASLSSIDSSTLYILTSG